MVLIGSASSVCVYVFVGGGDTTWIDIIIIQNEKKMINETMSLIYSMKRNT